MLRKAEKEIQLQMIKSIIEMLGMAFLKTLHKTIGNFIDQKECKKEIYKEKQVH
jgi:hypothetical protein